MTTPLANPRAAARIESIILTSPTFPLGGPLNPACVKRAARVAVSVAYLSRVPYGCATARETADALRADPLVTAVLDLVRATGKSAHSIRYGENVSDVVLAVAIYRGDGDPYPLQAQVNRYAAAMRAL